MVWDFAEANPFSESSGNYLAGIGQAHQLLQTVPASSDSKAYQSDAVGQSLSRHRSLSRPTRPTMTTLDVIRNKVLAQRLR